MEAVVPLTLEKYRLTVHVQDRYVRSEIAIHVVNTGSANEEYIFGVKLDKNEFISGLTMRIGSHG